MSGVECSQSFLQRLASDPVAVATLVLALVTVLAIVVPLIATRCADIAARRSARRQIVSLMDAIVDLLEQQMSEPTLMAGAGMDIIGTRLLDERLLRSLTPEVATSTTRACTMAHRVLCWTDHVAQARRVQNAGIIKQISGSALVAKNRIESARHQVTALGI